LNFHEIFYKNIQISNLMKVRAVGEELFRVNGRIERWTDRQMETHDETIAFRKFANVPKNVICVKIEVQPHPGNETKIAKCFVLHSSKL